jgi:hypothetical protein
LNDNAPKTEAQAPAFGQQMNGEQFAALLKETLQIVVMGMMSRHNMVPPQMMIASLSAAMGMVMSEVTATPVIATTLELRKGVQDIFAETLRKHVAALSAVTPGTHFQVKPDGKKH